MSVEVAIFVLRLLAGMSLITFLVLLIAIVWRSMRQLDRQLAAARATYGYLTIQPSDPGQNDSEIETFPLQAITTLGRSASNTIVVNDEFASGEHARVILDDGHWWLEDRLSRNGTRLNDETLDQRTRLADGDVIGIGSFSFRLSLESHPIVPKR